MSSIKTTSSEAKKPNATTTRSIRQEMRALKAEVQDTKHELEKTRALAKKEARQLKYRIGILDRNLDGEIARADAEALARADLIARAHSRARELEKANEEIKKANKVITGERECMKFLEKPREVDALYNFVVMRIFDTYKDFPPAQKRCILSFWQVLYELDKLKVIELYRDERDIYSVFKCSMISVNDGAKWREAMVGLVSTDPAFQCEEADWFKYDPANPTLCVYNMLFSAKFNQRQSPMKATEGVPWDDPIWYGSFCYRWWV